MSDEAPFFADLAEGPEGGSALWLHASDGVRIRVGFWGGGTRGTVVLLPGRTEYIEKYGRSAAELRARGWSFVTLDWRGQGLADRFLPDALLGHVQAFGDYQKDLDAVLGFVAAQGAARGLPGPLMLMSHSMGGLIALRGLMRGLPFKAAVFSAPMWGIRVPLWRRPTAVLLRRLAMALPQDRLYAPTASGKSYVLSADFEGNHLTGDDNTWAWLRRHLEREPQLRLGGPSLGWLRSALRECAVITRGPAPQLPTIVALGSLEHIVLPGPILKRLADWPSARLEIYQGARHEVPMERAEFRDRFFEDADQLFQKAAAQPT